MRARGNAGDPHAWQLNQEECDENTLSFLTERNTIFYRLAEIVGVMKEGVCA